MLFFPWIINYLATWLAGLIPYVVYLLSATLTPTPAVVAEPIYEPTVTAPTTTVYITPAATVQTYTSSSSTNGLYGSTIEQWVENSNWPSDYHATLERVIMCESAGQTTATNGPHVGLLQVNGQLHGQVPADAVSQLNQGYEVFQKQGWAAWSCY